MSASGGTRALAELLADVPAQDAYERVEQRELAETVPDLLAYLQRAGEDRDPLALRARPSWTQSTTPRVVLDLCAQLALSVSARSSSNVLEKLYTAVAG